MPFAAKAIPGKQSADAEVIHGLPRCSPRHRRQDDSLRSPRRRLSPDTMRTRVYA